MSHVWAGLKACAAICQTAHVFNGFKKSHIVWKHQEGIIVGVCFWFFMETWYRFALRAGLDYFSVTVLMSHNYSVLKCLCLVFTRSYTVLLETRDWVQCPGVVATVSEWRKFQTQTQTSKQSWHGVTQTLTTCLCLGSDPLISYCFQLVILALCLLFWRKCWNANSKTWIWTQRISDIFKFPLCGWLRQSEGGATS